MTRTLCLMIAAVVVAVTVGCGNVETPKNKRGGGDAKTAPGRKTVSLPYDLPDDIPIYPGARSTYVGSSEGGIRQSPSTSIQLETTDSAGKVRAFYEKEIPGQSWTIGHNTPIILNAKKGKRNLNVTIAEMPRSPGSVAITIVYN